MTAPSYERFVAHVETNQRSLRVLPLVISRTGLMALRDEHPAVMGNVAIRRRGGFITEISLTNPDTARLESILYCDSNRGRPSLRATHIVTPSASSQHTAGGEHGAARWLDFALRATNTPNMLLAQSQAYQPPAPHFQEWVQVATPSEAKIGAVVMGVGPEPRLSSLGLQTYLATDENRLDEVRLGGKTIDAAAGEGSLERILSGEEVTLPGPGRDLLQLSLPVGEHTRTMALGAHATLDRKTLNGSAVSIVVSHDVGTDSLCVSPFVNAAHDLSISPDSALALQTVVQLLS